MISLVVLVHFFFLLSFAGHEILILFVPFRFMFLNRFTLYIHVVHIIKLSHDLVLKLNRKKIIFCCTITSLYLSVVFENSLLV